MVHQSFKDTFKHKQTPGWLGQTLRFRQLDNENNANLEQISSQIDTIKTQLLTG